MWRPYGNKSLFLQLKELPTLAVAKWIKVSVLPTLLRLPIYTFNLCGITYLV